MTADSLDASRDHGRADTVHIYHNDTLRDKMLQTILCFKPKRLQTQKSLWPFDVETGFDIEQPPAEPAQSV